MFKYFLLAVSAAAALGAPVEHEVVPIISQQMDIEPEGKFHWSYESGDGSKATQFGDLKAVDKDFSVEVHHGAFEYKGDDGKTYSVSYTADDTGFHPEGDHLPVAPEVPAPIQRALAYLATLPPPKAT